ncbi:hypothetical protein BC833DRAFT_330787 [Globomyces pollinis-pini]|nr:hypothetical protein BC833DRAFT_330787 [Globomyces pollinis-pini]
MIKTHFNYSPMWRTVDKKVAEKRIFLENIITNTVLLDLTVACLQDEPSLRPNASQIISKLLELDQSDFEVYRGSDRSNSRLMDREETNIPLPNISSHTYIFSHTPGHYLFSELRLSNPSKWSDFIKAFMKRYVKHQRFDQTQFKSLLKVVSVEINIVHLNNLFRLNDALPVDANQTMVQDWIELLEEDIYDVIERCSR